MVEDCNAYECTAYKGGMLSLALLVHVSSALTFSRSKNKKLLVEELCKLFNDKF